MEDKFEMVAKTFQGLEEVLAEELRGLGASNVMPGRRMVSFEGNLETLYRANLSCRTALRILKPFYKFKAKNPDELYDKAKEFDWSTMLGPDKTFVIDTVTNSDEFSHSRFVTYRVKDAIVDWFRDRYGDNVRPGVRTQDADVMINVHISGTEVTLSLDSSGESLHKRGYREEQTEAPINEVLAAGIILRSGWRGDSPFVDPMCGSGTFLIEAALIAANINPGVYRKGFAFERWKDFDADLFDRLYNDDSGEREFKYKIYGGDISPRAVEIASRNIKRAGVGRYIELERRSLAAWEQAPQPAGVLVTNPPYGERISAPDMEALYEGIGDSLKKVFQGYHAWIIGYRREFFDKIHLAPSEKIPLLNGALPCELREYVMFAGTRDEFVRAGGKIGKGDDHPAPKSNRPADRFERSPRGERPSRFGNRDERPGSRRFEKGESSQRFGKSDRFGARPGSGERPSRYGKDDRKERSERFGKPERSERAEKPESENPFSMRRNPAALRSITGRVPKLPRQEGPMMRSRGWKKKDGGGASSSNPTDNTPTE